MRFFAVLAFVAAASAVSMRAPLTRRQSFPANVGADCSTACLTGADFGTCDPLDDGCLCNSSSFVNSVTTCIETACTGSDLENAEAAARQLCLAVVRLFVRGDPHLFVLDGLLGHLDGHLAGRFDYEILERFDHRVRHLDLEFDLEFGDPDAYQQRCRRRGCRHRVLDCLSDGRPRFPSHRRLARAPGASVGPPPRSLRTLAHAKLIPYLLNMAPVTRIMSRFAFAFAPSADIPIVQYSNVRLICFLGVGSNAIGFVLAQMCTCMACQRVGDRAVWLLTEKSKVCSCPLRRHIAPLSGEPGPEALKRGRTAQSIQTPEARSREDFMQPDNSHIRISSSYGGAWTLVGRDGVTTYDFCPELQRASAVATRDADRAASRDVQLLQASLSTIQFEGITSSAVQRLSKHSRTRINLRISGSWDLERVAIDTYAPLSTSSTWILAASCWSAPSRGLPPRLAGPGPARVLAVWTSGSSRSRATLQTMRGNYGCALKWALTLTQRMTPRPCIVPGSVRILSMRFACGGLIDSSISNPVQSTTNSNSNEESCRAAGARVMYTELYGFSRCFSIQTWELQAPAGPSSNDTEMSNQPRIPAVAMVKPNTIRLHSHRVAPADSHFSAHHGYIQTKVQTHYAVETAAGQEEARMNRLAGRPSLDLPSAMATAATISIPTWALIFASIASTLYLRAASRWRTRTRGLPSPPGPRGLPFIGNMLEFPRARLHFKFNELSAVYGDVVYFSGLGQSILVLGSLASASDYLNKHSVNTSSRPQTPMTELAGQSSNFGLLPYGPEWRSYMRAIGNHFNREACLAYRDCQRSLAHIFLDRLLHERSELKEHIRLRVISILAPPIPPLTRLRIVPAATSRGHSEDSLWHQRCGGRRRVCGVAEGATSAINEAIAPGKWVVEFLPWLQYLPAWVPGMRAQKDRWAKWQVDSAHARDFPYAFSVERLDEEDVQRSIIGRLIAERERAVSEHDELPGARLVSQNQDLPKNLAAVVFEAGSDTSYSMVQSLFLALSLYPEVVSKAHTELDAVVGSGRLPNFNDEASLVYVQAILMELLRWHAGVPLGIAHATTADEEWRGWFIPAGTVILPNQWAMSLDSSVYADPSSFRPERFITDGHIDKSVLDPLNFVFGFGRRSCPGKYMALNGLFINIASILHVLDITPPLDERGDVIKIKPTYTEGFLAYPEDIRCTIKVRSPEHERLIHEHAEIARAARGL
ncbi:cytochrome P450 [Epithele typhae]|uniref:cytochrome P450 n=1 Tax=Epithele typhae TaxID=378194 RepID=UPI002008DB45|nr:cytochrome P450 [Epithele typhae]KAH9929087.1 cytochrome P450 [Epithele typhae]